jgi:DNA polymerase III delta subunit
MISVLLGPDDFSKKEYIRGLARKQGAVTEIFASADEAPELPGFLEQDLFAKAKFFLLFGLLSKYDFDEGILSKLSASKNIIVFVEEKVDKRLSSSKLLLSHRGVETKEFALPHGKDLDAWIVKRAKDLGVIISKEAASLLAQKLGRDESIETRFGGKIADAKEIYNLWQADSEIKKLIAYANGSEIAEADIHELVFSHTEADTLQIANAIGEKNKRQAFFLVNGFLSQGGDEKGQIIQLNALLSEQFRNILMVQDFISRKTPEDEILRQTGWKSGRLFITKKTSARFASKTVTDLLGKLASLDREMKTSSSPPRVLLELTLSQLFI